MANADVLFRLEALLSARKGAHAGSSYVASLYAKGLDAVLKKVGEESTEFILAAKGSDQTHITNEAADLLFHTLIALAAKDVSFAAVVAELERREGRSGIEEKNARGAV